MAYGDRKRGSARGGKNIGGIGQGHIETKSSVVSPCLEVHSMPFKSFAVRESLLNFLEKASLPNCHLRCPPVWPERAGKAKLSHKENG